MNSSEREPKKETFTVYVDFQGSVSGETFQFDPDDIYDAALASVVRSIARHALYKAGVRQSYELSGRSMNEPHPPRRSS